MDDLSAEQIREYRGTLTEPGKNSPHRDRSIEENLELFEKMRRGEFANGSKVRVYVIPTNEELMIAKETERLV